MVDVEQRALRAFEHHALALASVLIQQFGDIRHQRTQTFGKRLELGKGLSDIHGVAFKIVLEREVMVLHDFLELVRERPCIQQVGDTQPAARDLVLVRRADATASGADGVLATRLFARVVERHVMRQDQRAGLAHAQALDYLHAVLRKLVNFLEQRIHRQHHAVADKAHHAVAQYARGNQVQYRLLAVDDERMPGVVSALKTHHRMRAIGEQIDNFSLALVTPLGADDDDILGHDYLPALFI